MNATRMWSLGSIVAIIAVLAGTWFAGISPRLDEAALANSDRANVEAQNQKHEATLASLKEQAEGLDTLKDELGLLRQAVPSGANLPDLIGQVNSLASKTGVTVTQLTAADPITFVPVEGEEAEAQLASALLGVTAENLLVIQVGMNLEGEYQKVMDFVNRLQLGERLILVHSLNLSDGPAVAGTDVKLALTGQAFVLLDGVQAAAAAAEGEAATDVATE